MKVRLRIVGDQRTKTLAELADPLRNDVDENLRAVDDFEGVLDERLFHRMGAAMREAKDLC